MNLKKGFIVLVFLILFHINISSMEEQFTAKILPSIQDKISELSLMTYYEGGYHYIVGKDDEIVKNKKTYLLQGFMYPEHGTVLGDIKESTYGSLGRLEWDEAKATFIPGMVETYKLFINPTMDNVEVISNAFLQSINDLPILQKLIAKFKIIDDTEKMKQGFPALVIYPTVGKANVEKLQDILSILFPNEKVVPFETKLLYVQTVEDAESIGSTQGEYIEKEIEENRCYFDADTIFYKKDCDPTQDPHKKSPYALGRSSIKNYGKYAFYGAASLALASLELYSIKNRSFSVPGAATLFGSWYKEISLGLAGLAFAGSSLAWYKYFDNYSMYRKISNYASKLKFS